MGYISEVNLNGQTHKVGSSLYGTCGTTASTATKVVVLADYSTLTVGTTIRVKFSYSNSVANPELNVNGLGAIPIYKYGTTTPGVSSELSWNAGAVVSFTYDGSAWMMNDWNNMSESVANVADGLAILATGDAHAAISSGQFVYVRNHGTADGFSGNAVLSDGLYVASASVSTNGALTTSNLTADGSGGLNALKSKIGNVGSTDLQSQVTTLNSNIEIKTIAYEGSLKEGFTLNAFNFLKVGKIVKVHFEATGTFTYNTQITKDEISTSVRPNARILLPCYNYDDGKTINGSFWFGQHLHYYGDSFTGRIVTDFTYVSL